MELSKYSKIGNKYFERKLKSYRELGLAYLDFWEKAYNEYIHNQSGSTDQGIGHTRDVEHNIWVLIEKYTEFFPKEVLYILSLASALHDCAKRADDQEDHALKGAKIIRETLVLKGWVNKQETANAIANIVSVHQSGNFRIFTEETITLGGLLIKIKDCAAIFRLADMMSTTEERGVRYHNMLGLPAPTLNLFLNSVRLDIQSCKPSTTDRTALEVTAHPDDYKARQNIDRYIKGLNNDITEEHQKLLENAKVIYVNKFKTVEKAIILPHKFVLTKDTFLEALREKTPTTFTIKEGAGRLVPCYFHNQETDIDIYTELMDSIEKDNVVNSKFLYWTLRGTKEYLSLCKDQNYLLPNIAHNLLKEQFRELYSIINSDGNLLHIVDLGVGDGQEINIILDAFISDSNMDEKIYCSLVDSSYHMLRVAINALDETNLSRTIYKEKFDICAINCDFRNVHLYKDLLRLSKGSRLFCLLGGTLGNFTENEVIKPISEEMKECDFFLLGVELIGNRTNEALISAYDNIIDKKFIFSPLAEIGFVFEDASFAFEIKSDISEIKNAKTIIARCSVDGKSIQMGKSTKYDLAELKSYLLDKYSFYSVKELINKDNNYALLLIRKKF